MSLVDFTQKTDHYGQLMLAYAKGDMAAFETLYKSLRKPLYHFFLRQCGNSALAEELYQELWMRVIRNRKRYAHKAKFTTWLYRIAHNLLADHFRKFEPETEQAEEETLSAAPANNPEIIAASQEKIERFRTLLEHLPDEQREVFLLKEEAGLSLDEIAQVTGAGFEAVKSRLRYAVRKLRQSLEDSAA